MTPAATKIQKQRDRNGVQLLVKLRAFLAQSPHTDAIHVVPVRRAQGVDTMRERMETHDGAEYIGRATLNAFRDRLWMKITQVNEGIGRTYTLTRAGAKALAGRDTK